MHKTILIPIDLNTGALSPNVIAEVNDYARDKNIKFHFVTVILPSEQLFDYGLTFPIMTDNAKSEDQRIKLLLEKLETMTDKFDVPKNQISTGVLLGSPAEAIIENAEKIKADLIIIGSKNPTLKSRLLGSTASALIHYANISVLVVR
ncbi:universal stress protein [Morganella psychrotolerans]|uniref:Universal stress protein n=1 Tax=Morganella psychrotolerans TaxID=368603 RepID=A0A5M9RCQ0_9GAMM|nr:universal stress protein [Morganella psychrotolerans]KAA8717748.1 universal stress protein [Morganella psychrotolerans]OBU08013.1 universal stress protein [Morganella psychrotolerans]